MLDDALSRLPDRRRTLGALTVLCVGLIVGLWTGWGVAGPAVPEAAVAPLAWSLFIGTVALAWTGLLLVTVLVVGRRRLAVAAATTVYGVLGLVYTVAEVVDAPGYTMGANEFGYYTTLWPVFFLWQDVCQLGIWPCPGG